MGRINQGRLFKKSPLPGVPMSSCFNTGTVWSTLLEIQSREVWKASGGEMENGVRSVYEDTQEHPRFRVVQAVEV
jgi:hypothetical protein